MLYTKLERQIWKKKIKMQMLLLNIIIAIHLRYLSVLCFCVSQLYPLQGLEKFTIISSTTLRGLEKSSFANPRVPICHLKPKIIFFFTKLRRWKKLGVSKKKKKKLSAKKRKKRPLQFLLRKNKYCTKLQESSETLFFLSNLVCARPTRNVTVNVSWRGGVVL